MRKLFVKGFIKLVEGLDNRDVGDATQLTLDFANLGHQDLSLSSFDYICSVDNLFLAWEKFRRGKRSRLDVLVFERNLEENIFSVQAKLKAQTYRHGSYVPFTICDPKQRQIHKATVVDRLIHQAVVSVIEPLFEPVFIYDSYSCRKDKGTHAAVNRLRSFLRKASRNNTRSVYALKLDIHKFFASVNHQILLEFIKKKVNDPKTLRLLEEIINSYDVTPGNGIPLGNLTSQLFANVYMHELDRFVKNELRLKFYLRYCDDFIIVSNDREELLSLVQPLAGFLNENLNLCIHPQKIVLRSWTQGIDFLGYVLKPHCTLLRTKTKRRLMTRVNANNLSSYLGFCSHANTYRLKQLILTKCA